MIKKRALFFLISTFVITGASAKQIWAQPPRDQLVLEDFSTFPQGWEARGGIEKAGEIYRPVKSDGGVLLLASTGQESVRIFKKISWDSKNYPVLQWMWRIKKWPEDDSGQVFFYVSLDKDIFGIPTLIKYAWSRDLPVGTVKEGGFFRPIELIIRSGAIDSGDWVIQKVNARADFRRFMERIPRGEAYGIGILVDPNMEVEIGEIVALRE